MHFCQMTRVLMSGPFVWPRPALDNFRRHIPHERNDYSRCVSERRNNRFGILHIALPLGMYFCIQTCGNDLCGSGRCSRGATDRRGERIGYIANGEDKRRARFLLTIDGDVVFFVMLQLTSKQLRVWLYAYTNKHTAHSNLERL